MSSEEESRHRWFWRPKPIVLVLLLSLAVPTAHTRAQAQQKSDISVDVKLVTVFATVREKHGAIVRNLTKDDFLLQEDGRPQTIQYFSEESDLPLTLGLLVDTSLSQREVLGQERDASDTFLDHLLREDSDRAFVIHFDREVELLQDVTSSRKKLESSLELLGVSPRNSDPQSGAGGDHHGGLGGRGTLLYDAIYLASDELMKKQQGRKALILLTDGVDRGSKETLQSSIEAAQRADTLVYSILFAGDEGARGGFGGPHIGLGPAGGGGHHRFPREEERPDGKKVLEQISAQTGGHLYEVSKKESIEEIYARIEEELRNQYRLAYTPEPTDAGPGYRKIHLIAKQKELTVQAREGYYAEK